MSRHCECVVRLLVNTQCKIVFWEITISQLSSYRSARPLIVCPSRSFRPRKCLNPTYPYYKLILLKIVETDFYILAALLGPEIVLT